MNHRLADRIRRFVDDYSVMGELRIDDGGVIVACSLSKGLDMTRKNMDDGAAEPSGAPHGAGRAAGAAAAARPQTVAPADVKKVCRDMAEVKAMINFIRTQKKELADGNGM